MPTERQNGSTATKRARNTASGKTASGEAASAEAARDEAAGNEPHTMELRLYVAAQAPNSVQAIANLAKICRDYLQNNCRVEIIDVLEQPQRAWSDGIVVTPSLATLSPHPVVKVIGNLSDPVSVLTALGLNEEVLS